MFGDNYKGTDPLQIFDSAKLVKYVAASIFAFEDGKFDDFQSLSADEAIIRYYDEARVEEFGQNFNSPGKFSIIAAVGSFSILASAGLYVATADPSKSFQDVKTEAVDQVKGSIHGGGKAAKTDILDNYVDSMKATNWKKVQEELGKPSNKTLPLNLSNKVEVANHRAELNAK